MNETESDVNQNNVDRAGSLARGVLASVLAALMLTGIQFLVSRFVADQLLSSFLSAIIGVVAIFLGLRLRVINIFEVIGSRYLDARTGIIRVYPSLNAAADDMRASFSRAHRVDLLLHMGRREFGVQDAMFTDVLRSRITEPDFEIRVLHIDSESPYLSQERAQRLGKRRSKWIRDVQYVRDHIVELSGARENLRLAGHREPFVWRVFIFDADMFVSGYLHQTRNDDHAPVFKLREGANSLFAPFRAYYDHLWRLYAGDLRLHQPKIAEPPNTPLQPTSGAGTPSL